MYFPMSKKGILLLNLGSPEALTVPAVREYLNEFLMDGRVIDVFTFLAGCWSSDSSQAPGS